MSPDAGPESGDRSERSGPTAYMARNSIAANIEVSMAYPGATPEEIEESIVVKIEDHTFGRGYAIESTCHAQDKQRASRCTTSPRSRK